MSDNAAPRPTALEALRVLRDGMEEIATRCNDAAFVGEIEMSAQRAVQYADAVLSAAPASSPLPSEPVEVRGTDPMATEQLARILTGHVDGCVCDLEQPGPYQPCELCMTVAEMVLIHMEHSSASPVSAPEAPSSVDRLRAALVGLVGVDTPDELRQMEEYIRALADTREDAPAILNAIGVLLAIPSAPKVSAASPVSAEGPKDADLQHFADCVTVAEEYGEGTVVVLDGEVARRLLARLRAVSGVSAEGRDTP